MRVLLQLEVKIWLVNFDPWVGAMTSGKNDIPVMNKFRISVSGILRNDLASELGGQRCKVHAH